MAFDLKSYAALIRVTDGAWGTQLQQLGLAAGLAPERWNADNPELVQQVAQNYVQAGSDVILTNTFGANRLVLGGHGMGDRVAELAEAGVAISKRAASSAQPNNPGPAGKRRDVKVFASMGPSGKIVMTEEVSAEELEAAFCESAEALQWGGADAVVLESFNELAELEIALKAVKKSTTLPVVLSMTFSSGPQGANTLMGNKPSDLARLAHRHKADAVGANCGVGPQNYVKVARLLRQETDLPIWIKPNAGLPVLEKGRTTFPMGAAEFAGFVPALIEAGANFIGGCCGTTPKHIQAVRAAVDGFNR